MLISLMLVEFELKCLHDKIIPGKRWLNDGMIEKTFRISDEEDRLLKASCQQKEKTENQVVRELIAKLKDKTAPKGAS